jgi:hypothetical protein
MVACPDALNHPNIVAIYATIIMGNQSQFDNAAPKLRMMADRRSGEAHPLDVGAGTAKP